MLLCLGAYGCDPADPVPNFMDFNDKDHDGALSLQEWMASEVPPGLRVELNLRSGSEFKRPDANHDGKIGLDELGGRNRLQRFIGPKIRALFGLGRTDPRIKINPPSNNAQASDETAFCAEFGLRDAYKFYFARVSTDQFCFAICVKFISSTTSVCMIASAVIWLNLKEKNEYSFYGNAQVCG